MPDQLTECARKAAEEIATRLGNGLDLEVTLDGREMAVNSSSFVTTDGFVNDMAAIVERHMKKMMDGEWDILGRHAEDISKIYARREQLEQALTAAYAKLNEAKGILGKVL